MKTKSLVLLPLLVFILFLSPSLSLAQRNEERKANLEEAREKRKEIIQKVQMRLDAATKSAETKRENLKQRLSGIKDERKKMAVERLDAKMAEHNAKWVRIWNHVLTRLTEILAKVEGRVDRLEESGADVTAARAAIDEAEAAIAQAQAAVDIQSTQTYVVTVTSEETLEDDVVPIATDFKSDVRAVQEKVKQAREAVHKAFQALRQVRTGQADSASPSPVSSSVPEETPNE